MKILVRTDSHIDGGAKLQREVEAIVKHAVARFGDRLTRVEAYLSDANSSRRASDNDKQCVIEARLSGLEPVTVRHDGALVNQAVVGAADKLRQVLTRLLRRKNSLYKRRIRERAESADIAKLLQRDAETRDQEDFMKVLRPLLGRLGNHARRELRLMEADGTLYPGQIVFADLLDEAVNRAWLQFADRPHWMEVDLWLTKIVDEILEEQARHDARLATTAFRRTDDVLPPIVCQVDDQDFWACLLGDDESTTDESETPGRHAGFAEEFLEAEDLMYRVHELLGDLPKSKRQAFALNVLEAYDPTEIAMLQCRPETDVQADIQSTRDKLRARLSGGVRSHSVGPTAMAVRAD